MKKEKSNSLRRLTATILSISLLTVMAGAAMAPALGVVRDHFSHVPELAVKLIVSMPALFIIITNLFFTRRGRLMRTRTLALVGLLLYVGTGAGAFFATGIGTVLTFRALLGVSVGMIMPLSTGLMSYYFPPEEQAHLMGLSAAMNQMGGVVATLLAGLLAGIGWNYAFLVYLIGLVAVVLVLLYLPNERLEAPASKSLGERAKVLMRFHPSVVGMWLLMTIFFIFPTNFAITARLTTSLSSQAVTAIMVGLDVVAFAVGLTFGSMMKCMAQMLKYVAPIGFALGYACYAWGGTVAWLIAGSVLIGVANGVGVPYLNTIASIKAGRNAATTVMPLLSAALYLGQFTSPLIVSPLAQVLPVDSAAAPYVVGVAISAVMLVQVHLTRHHQSLPPNSTDHSA